MEKDYNLERFVKMQEIDYKDALSEIKNGHKRSHWIWYIFPQLKGLGHSFNSDYFGIDGIEEAKQYMNNEYLRHNMLEICGELYKLNDSVDNIFGHPDNLKVNSSMTLFECSTPEEKIFGEIIDKFYDGKRDEKTLSMIRKNNH